MAKQKKYVYFFGDGKADGNASMKDLLGGKGSGLAEMTNAGVPVPPGFTITTDVCRYFYSHKRKLPKELDKQADNALRRLEKSMDKRFGDPEDPLLVSVRSGAKFSMPGMMDTILNLGLNDRSIEGLAKRSGNPRFAYDAYRRLIQMFGNVVLGIGKEKFEHQLHELKRQKGVKLDIELTAEDFRKLVGIYKDVVRKEKGVDFPQDPFKQLQMARDAVFNSWNNPRAITYRKLNKIPDDLGTAVNIQTMVFGNMGNDSATGVGFTRNPSTGANEFYGEYLTNAQGEDVVAGIRTPHPIKDLSKEMPKVYKQLRDITSRLEKHYKDVQDFEFTVEKNKLYMLQTRTGKRTAHAAVEIAVEMVKEKLITKEEALMRLEPEQIDQLLHPIIDPKAKIEVIAKGLPASPGAAKGRAVFTADEAVKQEEEGPVILVRLETCPDDIHGMDAAEGILTARGGMTCIAGGTLVLTNNGFLSAEGVFNRMRMGEDFAILSYDSKNKTAIFKDIVASGRRKEKAIEVSLFQTGRASDNILRLTEDHKMYTFENRELVKKPLRDILHDKEYLCIIEKIGAPNNQKIFPDLLLDERLAYLAGAIFTDGYISLKRTKGSVTFTQKETPEKLEFINIVDEYFSSVFQKGFNIRRNKKTSSILRGRRISGETLDLIATRKEPAVVLNNIKKNIIPWVLSLDENKVLNFIAGVVDGDGSFCNNRFQIYISKEFLAQAVVAGCLRLGIVPQVTRNRDIYNIQIVEKLDAILGHTHRVKGKIRDRMYGTRLFAARQLFGDIVDNVNYKGRLRQWVNRNLLIDAEKIKRDILPLCCPNPVQKEINQILGSDLRMYRVAKSKEAGEEYVYNFEVRAENEMDKNFIVFSKQYTPVLVSNSHAAVVARGMGKPCVAGCEVLHISEKEKKFSVGDIVVKEGDVITIDGSVGNVILGDVPTIEPSVSGKFAEFMKWADSVRKLGVRANADIPRDAKVAREFGAEGIGLCRTEHMFFAPDRIPLVQEMILAETEEERKKALEKLMPLQKGDFLGLFKEMKGYPVIIRTLDPPLHEFLPKREELMVEVAVMKTKGEDPAKLAEKEKLLKRVEQLHEFNPMLGHRGCRLGITYPEMTQMQVRAIMEAACELAKQGETVIPEIMIPLVGAVEEFRNQKEVSVTVAEEVMKKYGVKIKYMVGTMIEIPRAAVTADEIAKEAEFFSFGTNDLTQMTYGFSRDDAGKFIRYYIDKKILKSDPFQTIDQDGVGQLVEMGIERGRRARKTLEVGICGEHGGEPESVKFCHRVGMNYVSCSPYRVPIARLAAAQAVIQGKKKKAYDTR